MPRDTASYRQLGLSPIAVLDSGWQTRRSDTPYLYYTDQDDEADFSLEFRGQEYLQGQRLSIVFPNIMGEVQLYLNDKLIDTHTQPSPYWQVTLPPAALSQQWNMLRVHCRRSRQQGSSRLYIPPFIGFVSPPLFVSTAFKLPAGISCPAPRDSLLLLAAYHPRWGCALPDTLISTWLTVMGPTHRAHAAWAYPPPRKLVEQLAARGICLPIASQDQNRRYLAFFNQWPGLSSSADTWLNSQHKRTEDWGTYAAGRQPALTRLDALLLSLFLLVPLSLLAGWKLLDPESFIATMSLPLQRRKLWLAIRESNFPQGIILLYICLARILISYLMVLATLLLVEQNAGLSLFNLLQNRSLIYERYDHHGGQLLPVGMFLALYLLAHEALIALVSWVIAGIFRQREFVQHLQQLKIVSEFPFNIFVILLAFILLLGNFNPKFSMILLFLSHGIYQARRIQQLHDGWRQLGQRSRLGIVLYICTVELLPWIFLV